MFEQYRTRIRRLLEKLPEGLWIHYRDTSGKEHCVTEDDLFMTMIEAEREDRRHIIEWMDPLDLDALLAKRPIFNVLLLCDGYKPAYKIVVRDPESRELHELTPEEEVAWEEALEAMTEKEREKYWKDQEAAFRDHFRKGEEP